MSHMCENTHMHTYHTLIIHRKKEDSNNSVGPSNQKGKETQELLNGRALSGLVHLEKWNTYFL